MKKGFSARKNAKYGSARTHRHTSGPVAGIDVFVQDGRSVEDARWAPGDLGTSLCPLYEKLTSSLRLSSQQASSQQLSSQQASSLRASQQQPSSEQLSSLRASQQLPSSLRASQQQLSSEPLSSLRASQQQLSSEQQLSSLQASWLRPSWLQASSPVSSLPFLVSPLHWIGEARVRDSLILNSTFQTSA